MVGEYGEYLETAEGSPLGRRSSLKQPLTVRFEEVKGAGVLPGLRDSPTPRAYWFRDKDAGRVLLTISHIGHDWLRAACVSAQPG